MTVYIDVVFMENIFMNYIILFATAIINKSEVKLMKILLSSIIGSLYTVVSYMAVLSDGTSIMLKLLLSIAMVYIAFGPSTIKRCIKYLIIFYLTSFTFGGVAFALLYFIKPGEILMKNGIYIGTYPLKVALLGGIIGFVIITIAFKNIKGKLSKRDMLCEIEIKIEEKTEKVIAMLDTGNLLKEPITGVPVVIVETGKLNSIIPNRILDNIQEIIKGNIGESTEISEYISRFRVIPFNSLGKQNGLLLGIKADSIMVKQEDKSNIVKNVIIGLYEKEFCKNGEYSALIGLDAIEGRDNQDEYIRNAKN